MLGIFHSPLFLVVLLSILAAGVYSFPGPFLALPCEFLTGYPAAAGIGLINSVGNLGGFVGPYAIGVMSGWTGGIYRGLALAGIPLLLSATLLLLLPRKAQVGNLVGNRSCLPTNYTNAEHDRLIRQAANIAPITERLFREAGIGPGQRVLDLGSGVGDVSMVVARLVGPWGDVVGIERDAGSIARANTRVAEA